MKTELSRIKIQLSESQQVWFSSDQHIEHTGIVKGTSKWAWGTRPFMTQYDHSRKIIDTINKMVKENDILVLLGDFVFTNDIDIRIYRGLIRCKNIYFCLGNHDHNIRKNEDLHNLFCQVSNYFEFQFIIPDGSGGHKKHDVVASHYALDTWNGSNRGSIMLHGHSHGSLPISRFRKMDVGVDTNKNFAPYNFQYDILPMMSKRKNRNHHPDTFYQLIRKLSVKMLITFGKVLAKKC